MRHLFAGAGVVVMLSAVAAAASQTVIDRTVRVINGDVILQSDVERARVLKLVVPDVMTDESVLTELENRVLVLAVVRSSPVEPTADELAARRRRWEASLGAGAPVAALLDRMRMSEAELTEWLRNDVRIDKYLSQRFGRQADPATSMANWIKDMRRRAGLK